MLLVTCKEVIGDLIKNGSNRKHLVSHMTGTLEWGSSIFWVLTWRTKFFSLYCFATFRVLACPKLTVLMVQHCQQNFVTCRWPLLWAERELFCVSLFRREKTFLKCTISWLTFTSYWLVLVWHTSSKHSHWKSSMVDLELRCTPGGQRGAQHLKHSAAPYLEKALAFWASQKGKMCLGVVSWLGS